jgi:hypothetical protein
MNQWKHRDSELDRTCGKLPTPVTREVNGVVSAPFCASCDGDVYKVHPLDLDQQKVSKP